MDEVGELTGRHYSLYDYYGHPEAERVVVGMGSATRTLEEVADHLNDSGEKVGVMKVRLFRPFAADKFIAAFPETARDICVLDRTREDGAMVSLLPSRAKLRLSWAQRQIARAAGNAAVPGHDRRFRRSQG